MKRRGFSILELSIVMALVGMLLTLVTLFFLRAGDFTKDTEVYARVQSEASGCLRAITDDLYQASATWTEYYGDSFLFLSSQKNQSSEASVSFDPMTGQVVWKKWVGYYLVPTEKRVYRSSQPLATPSASLATRPLPDITIEFLKGEPGLQRRVVGRSVSQFQVSGTGTSFIVAVTCQDNSPVTRRLPQDKLVEVTASTEVNLLN